MKLRYGLFAATALLLLACAAPRYASASCIAISKDSTFVDCRAVIVEPFVPGTLYVVAAMFGDPATDGVTGAEFRINGFPASWFVSATPNPAALGVSGDPFHFGCSITFSYCQTRPWFVVLLFTLTYLPTDAAVHDVNVVAASPPFDPLFDCPVMTLCDVNNRTRLCVTGGYFRFNNVEPCEVAVEPTRWSEVKALYR